MKITCTTCAYLVESGSDDLIAAPRCLDGWVYEEDTLEPYLEDELDDQGIVGGRIRALVTLEGEVQIVVDYWAPTALDDATLELLRDYTEGHMSDGMGECGFDIVVEGRKLTLMPDLGPPVQVEQYDDGRKVRPPSRVVMAARDGDLAMLKQALESGEEVDSLLGGYTGLSRAILSGRMEAALMLLQHGADPNKPDPHGGRPLEDCALSNSLSDEASARLAQALLRAGADPNHVNSTGETAKSYAEIRGKQRTVEVLSASLDPSRRVSGTTDGGSP